MGKYNIDRRFSGKNSNFSSFSLQYTNPFPWIRVNKWSSLKFSLFRTPSKPSDERSICELCDKEFESRQHLLQHQLLQHGSSNANHPTTPSQQAQAQAHAQAQAQAHQAAATNALLSMLPGGFPPLPFLLPPSLPQGFASLADLDPTGAFAAFNGNSPGGNLNSGGVSISFAIKKVGNYYTIEGAAPTRKNFEIFVCKMNPLGVKTCEKSEFDIYKAKKMLSWYRKGLCIEAGSRKNAILSSTFRFNTQTFPESEKCFFASKMSNSDSPHAFTPRGIIFRKKFSKNFSHGWWPKKLIFSIFRKKYDFVQNCIFFFEKL
jgi:hypothetical protein